MKNIGERGTLSPTDFTFLIKQYRTNAQHFTREYRKLFHKSVPMFAGAINSVQNIRREENEKIV